MKPTTLTFCAVAMATLVVSGAHARTHCDVPAECVLIARDNSSVSIDTSPGVCVLVKTLDFTLASTSNIFVVFDLGHSHGCCHHTSLVFQLDLDGETIFEAELPFVAGSPGGCRNTTVDCTFLGDVAAGDHTVEIFLCDEGQNCILEIYACPAIGAPVDLDIKPGSCPNSYNRNSHGVLPVALVGTEGFDVTQVDLDSLLLRRKDGEPGEVAPNFGPPGPSPTVEDAATPFAGPEQCDCHELTGDGIDDLMLHFRTDDVVANLDLNSFSPGALVSLTLVGELNNGTAFEVDDCVRLVPPGTPAGMLAVHSNVTDAWIDLSPIDNQLDGGGFATFVRTFPLSSVVTLTAPKTQNGWSFAGWRLTSIASQDLPDDPPGGLIPGRNLVLTLDSVLHTVEAIYAPPDRDLGPDLGSSGKGS